MPFASPFEDLALQESDGTVSVCIDGEWAELVSINGVEAVKVAKIAAALAESDDAAGFMKRNLTEAMDALDAPLTAKTPVVLKYGDKTVEQTVDCPSLEVENLEAKLEATTSAMRGVVQLAGLLGLTDKELKQAYMLAATSGEMDGMPPGMDQMAAMMGAAAMIQDIMDGECRVLTY